MNVVIGASGKTGGAAAAALLEVKQPVRAAVRHRSKGESLAAKGAEVAVCDLDDEDSLAEALKGACSLIFMNPTAYDGGDQCGLAERRAKNTIAAIQRTGSVKKLVVLSSIAAQLHDQPLGLIKTCAIQERLFSQLAIPVAFVRPAWFLDNFHNSVFMVKEGSLPGFLKPDIALDMVWTADVGAIMAQTLLSDWAGRRVIEVKAPKMTSISDAAAIVSEIVGKPVKASWVPEEHWATVFKERSNASSSFVEEITEMLRLFNQGGHLVWEGGSAESVVATTPAKDYLRRLLAQCGIHNGEKTSTGS